MSSASPDTVSILPRKPELSPILGVVIGRLVSLGADGVPRVDYPGNPVSSPVPAIAAAASASLGVGDEVALMFQGGDPRYAIVIGPIARPEQSGRSITGSEHERQSVSIDGERVTLEAGKEIVLRCGDASITLTRAGKILIRGAYVVSRSSGVNRIKGGSVQIN